MFVLSESKVTTTKAASAVKSVVLHYSFCLCAVCQAFE